MLSDLLNTIIPDTLEEIIKYAFSFLCHQDKTFLVKFYHNYIPLCPRCIGLHSGFFPAFAALILKEKVGLFNFKEIPRLIPVLLITIAGIHWLGASFNMFINNFQVRFFTGLISGFSFAFLLFNYQEIKGLIRILLKAIAKSYLYSIPPLILTLLLLKEMRLLILILGLIVLLNTLALIVALYSLFRIPADHYQCFTT